MVGMSETKKPTPQAISALLKRAGFERAVIGIQGGKSGFKVEQCRTRVGAVKVRQVFLIGGMPPQHYRGTLRRYATAIEAAGYQAEVCTYNLIVTAAAPDVSVILSEAEE